MPWEMKDRPKGQTDVLKGLKDVQTMLNNAKTSIMGHGNGASTYLGAGGAKCSIKEWMAQESHGCIDQAWRCSKCWNRCKSNCKKLKTVRIPKRSRSYKTHLLTLRDGKQVRQMALEAMQMQRLCAQSPDKPCIGYDMDTTKSEAQNISMHPTKLKYVMENTEMSADKAENIRAH